MKSSNLFLERERLLKKGTVNISEIQRFVPCGYIRAKQLHEHLKQEIENEGKSIGMFGIRTKRLMKYLKLTEKEIYHAAELERQKKDD